MGKPWKIKIVGCEPVGNDVIDEKKWKMTSFVGNPRNWTSLLERPLKSIPYMRRLWTLTASTRVQRILLVITVKGKKAFSLFGSPWEQNLLMEKSRKKLNLSLEDLLGKRLPWLNFRGYRFDWKEIHGNQLKRFEINPNDFHRWKLREIVFH